MNFFYKESKSFFGGEGGGQGVAGAGGSDFLTKNPKVI